tara:strand:- start:1681 stop:1788 length:108 start_codon:yes stop_codon:yes gene_type:complete
MMKSEARKSGLTRRMAAFADLREWSIALLHSVLKS